MRRLLRAFLLPAVLALAAGGRAEAQPLRAQTLTLSVALDRALERNLTVAAARRARAVNEAGLALARERPNPEATLEFAKETPKQAFGVALPIELGGKRERRIALGEAAVRTGDAELTAIVAQVRTDVRRAYFEAVVADSRLDVLKQIEDLSRRVVEAAQARFDAGDAPRLEVLQTTLALASAENDAVAARGGIAAARARLNALIGEPLDAALPLATPVDAVGVVSVADAQRLASAASAELALLDRRVDEQRARLALAHAQRVPDVVPAATLTHDAQPEFTYGWRAGVAVTLPVLTAHKAAAQVEQAELDRLLAERDAAGVRIAADVAAAGATAEALRQAYVRYRDTILPQAAEVERLAQDAYRLGQTNLAALLQALQASRDVRLRSLTAAMELQRAIADLERAIGAPLQ